MKILRYALCFIVSFFSLYLSGFPNLVSDLHPNTATWSAFGAAFIVSLIVFAIFEMYLSFKRKIDELVYRIGELEEALSQKEK